MAGKVVATLSSQAPSPNHGDRLSLTALGSLLGHHKTPCLLESAQKNPPSTRVSLAARDAVSANVNTKDQKAVFPCTENTMRQKKVWP
jgi:hypothetical protein